MNIPSTRSRLQILKEQFIKDMQDLLYPIDYDDIIEKVQDLIDDIFGEEYRSQLTESEVHIFNSLLHTLDIDAAKFCGQRPTSLVVAKYPASTNKGAIIGMASGFAVGLVLSTVITKHLASILAGLIVCATTYAGYSIQKKLSKKNQSHHSLGLSNDHDSIKGAYMADEIFSALDKLCGQIDDFMEVSHIQFSK